MINRTVGIRDSIACTIDDGCVRVRRHIGLADNTVGYAAICFRGIRILVDVDRTIRQSRCTAEVKALSCPRIDDAGIGTGYCGSNAVCMSAKSGSHTACTLGAIIIVVASFCIFRINIIEMGLRGIQIVLYLI